MEFLILGLFCLGLLLCIVLDASILYALAAGLLLFLVYGKIVGFSWKELFSVAFSGIKTVKNILITFLLIGMLTALWRSAGTIPTIVCYAAQLIRPSIFLLMAFLLNCLVSVLTGTAFGTAATMGVICATMASTMQISPVLVGGAVLSGVYFGDRCSPVSTSALLVSELTKTSIFENIKHMVKSALVSFIATCGIYAIAGLINGTSGETIDLRSLFGSTFTLHWITLFPAIAILALSLMRIRVKAAMAVSILVSLPICIWVQHVPVAEIPSLLIFGYKTSNPEISEMINGGGILSMLKVAAIVCLSSSYSGIFEKTGLLNRLKEKILVLSERTNPYTAILCTSAAAGMIACNQTLTIMLTHQLCDRVEPDSQKFANTLENTAVVVAPLVPWSIAGAVPLASIGSPTSSLLFACFLYLLPLWSVLKEAVHHKQDHK